jgi:hypothetical protein
VPENDDGLKTHDFDRVVKLSYILEGVKPDQGVVPSGSEPPIVKHLIDLHHPGQKGWSSRDGQDSHRDRRLSTAVVLHALRRFPGAQKDPHVIDAYDWFAKQMQIDGVQIDLAALGGLALVEASQSVRDSGEVGKALEALDKKLAKWAAKQKRLSIDRPYFNGFVEHDKTTGRDSTDYVFLSPEVLAARYFLKRDLPQTRRFVLKVVCGLVNNIGRNTANEMGGFKIQETMIRTVDQAWAMDLLESFEEIRKDKPRQLLPRRTGWLSSRGVLIALWVALFAVVVPLAIIASPLVVVVGPLLAIVLFGIGRARGR